MYFVVIDLPQLFTRLTHAANGRTVDVDFWLRDRGFKPSDDGYLATSDAMNSLSCSEILYSERRYFEMPRPMTLFARMSG